MKKIIALLLALSMLTPAAVLADEVETIVLDDTVAEATAVPEVTEESPEATATPEVAEESPEATATPEAALSQFRSDKVVVDIIVGNHQVEIDSSAHFNLFNSEGVLVSTAEAWIGGDTESVSLVFNIENGYNLGEIFTLGFVDGFHSLTYYTETIKPGGSFELGTYYYYDENNQLIAGDTFAMDAEPNFERGLNFYYNNKLIEMADRGRLVDGIGMLSAYEMGKAMGLSVKYHEDYNSLTMSLGDEQLIFNIDTTYATFFGTDLNLSHAPVWIDETIYIPVRDVLNALSCTIDLWQDADHIDVIAGESPVIVEYRSRERVNREGITSRTNYLIWISKSDFTVKVYEGERYNWQCIYTAPCAIGAPWTPTVEGQFEYLYRGGLWDYGSYYVYPTMMFYGGYALHSTLRSYGGGEWDGRVGVMISHGCVRLHPQDIEWIYSRIPIGTRIYVTP